MPLDVVRLRDSDLIAHATGEGFRCAVLLWCVAWHQVPAGSLPNDEKSLANFVGYARTPREWKKHRADALRGWIECSDGRLYHPVVAEKANAAWTARLRDRWKSNCAAIKKAAQRRQDRAVYPTFEQWREHFEATGSESWRPDFVHGDKPGRVPGDNGGGVPGDSGERPPTVPGDTGTNRSQGKLSDLPDTEGVTTPPPAAVGSDDRPADHFGQFEGHENPARPLLDPVVACAIELRRAGIQVTRLDKNLGPFVVEGGKAADIVELSKLDEFQDKPSAYITAAALRKLRDAKKNPTGGTNDATRSTSGRVRGQSLADEAAAIHDADDDCAAGRSEPAAGAVAVIEGSAIRVRA
ncbi:DUF1376 domain-containing protein [Lysobacter sp. CA199]|uniref:DUF1376 domain-containing protein n=1 Tax=Lysobacter sp. CA199 TaxID=3455608 RepID=UPI003F8D4A5C